MILTGFLRTQGLDARILELTGHTVVAVLQNGNTRLILDPDFGVALPFSLQEAEKNPESVRPYYRQAVDGMGHSREIKEKFLNDLVEAYGEAGNRLDEAGGNAHAGKTLGFEKWAYRAKWWIPLALMLPWIFFRRYGIRFSSTKTGRIKKPGRGDRHS